MPLVSESLAIHSGNVMPLLAESACRRSGIFNIVLLLVTKIGEIHFAFFEYELIFFL